MSDLDAGPLVPPCPRCAEPQRPGAGFCPRCGYSLAGAMPAGLSGELSAVSPQAGRGLAVALAVYFCCLLPILVILLTGEDSLTLLTYYQLWILVVGLVGLYLLDGFAIFRLPRLRMLDLAWGGLGVLALFGLAMGISRLFPQVFIDELAEFRGKGIGTAFLHMAVLPPVVEEIAFRGAIFDGFSRVMKEGVAVIVTALIFATLHLSVLSFLHLGLAGVLFGLARRRTGSIYPSMLLHAIYNGLIVLVDW